MPRELVTVAPHTPGFREYAEPPLGDTQIRIRTEFAAPKHGTEMVSYRAGRTDRDARPDRRYDGEWSGAALCSCRHHRARSRRFSRPPWAIWPSAS